MLSYRHGFHAGNHADVLKHLCLLVILEKLTAKDKPAVYIDTHAGAGLYDLESPEATKTSEYLTGVDKLKNYSGNNPDITSYQQIIARYLARQQYPGSPMLALEVLRETDKLHLMELHNSEIDNLRDNLNHRRVTVHHRDGFEGLIALVPPAQKRGLVLIDPAYERADEYLQVTNNLQKAIRKWPTGVYAIWYPLLSARAGKKAGQSQNMLAQLVSLAPKNALNVSFEVSDPRDDLDMYGSGLLIINPPWQLDEALQLIGSELPDLLGAELSHCQFKLEWLKHEDQE